MLDEWCHFRFVILHIRNVYSKTKMFWKFKIQDGKQVEGQISDVIQDTELSVKVCKKSMFL